MGQEAGVPAWTVQEDKQGLDPLGMQNTSISMYQFLLPGVSNVTLRMRYYGLHTWLLWEYAQREHSGDPDDWCIFLRRAEALYALVSQHNTQDAGVAGNRWATNQLQRVHGGRIRFAASTDRKTPRQYLRQKFGAFGAAYSSQLDVVGLIELARNHDIPVPTESGKKLADVFKRELGARGRLFLEVANRGQVDVTELARLARIAPSSIASDSPERQFYEDLLFAPSAPSDAPAAQRRRTLRLVLHTARELGRVPGVSDVRWASYSGFGPEGTSLPLLQGRDGEHRSRWRTYHANDLMHVCHESLLRFALETLVPYPDGIALRTFLEELVGGLLEVASPRSQTWAAFEASVPVANNAWSDEPTSEWSLAQSLLNVGQGVAGASITFEALRLLAVINKRFRSERPSVQTALKDAAHANSQTIISEAQFLEARKDVPIQQALTALIKERVLDRHLAVAFQKLRAGDYTFLFEVQDGRIRMRRKSGPVLTNPRLGSAITFLHDIHLIDAAGLTKAGARVLAAA